MIQPSFGAREDRSVVVGTQALDAAREFQPHIVILDVWTPTMTPTPLSCSSC